MTTAVYPQNPSKINRIGWLDNLRTFIVFLVIVAHACGVYESSGSWASFWIVDDTATNNVVGLLFIILDIFMMPTLFFVAGYVMLPSLQNRTCWAFLAIKFKRLMIPWFLAVLTLIPLYKVIFLGSRNLPQESWTTYFHWSNGIWSQNWLWFLPLLFCFNIIYLLISKIKAPLLSVKTVLAGVFVIGVANSVCFDYFGWRGWTHTPYLDFQNERVLVYLMAFTLGAFCFNRGVLVENSKRPYVYHILNSIAWIPVTIYIIFLLYPWIKPGQYLGPATVHRLILWGSFHLSLFLMVYLTLETFRRYFPKVGPMWKELNSNSYGVYIIHVIVLGSIALGLRYTGMPSLLKWIVLSNLTFGICHLLVYSYKSVISHGFKNHQIVVSEGHWTKIFRWAH